jgi:hypothetical protein
MSFEKMLRAAMRSKLLNLWSKISPGVWAFRPGPARWMVNLRIENIFKGIFEVQKSTRSGVLNAKIRALATCRFRINHVCVKHDWEPREITNF